jgi:peptide/nickel transport system substrate-binding protein
MISWRAALLAASALALAAPARAGVRPAYGGVLRLALPTAPQGADPARAQEPADVLVARATSGALLEVDAAGRVLPGILAEVPSPEADGRTWRLRVRPGLRTAAGAPVTAADVAAALARLLSFGAGSPHAWMALPIAGADEVLDGRRDRPAGLRVDSDAELTVTLSFALPELPALLALHPLAIPGAGPFALARDGAAGARLVANPNHPRGRPYLDAVELAPADARAAARRLERGAVDAVIRPEAAGDAAVDLPVRSATLAALNGRRLGSAAPAVRRALAALDRSELARRFVRGPAVPLAALLGPGAPAAAADPPEPGPAPSAPVRLRVLVPDDPDQRGLASRLQVKLFDAGLRAVLEPADAQRFAARLRAGDYDVALVTIPVPSWSPPLAAGAVAFAVRGAPAARRAMAALAGQDGDALAAAARKLARELEVVPLVASGLRLTARREVQGLLPAAAGGGELGDAWLLGGGTP